MNNKQKFFEDLLKTSTGSALCDSGGVYGRHWERNQKIESFTETPEVEIDIWEHKDRRVIEITASLYHWLVKRFEIDELCNEFNALPVDDWDSDAAYGLSLHGERWLEDHGFEIVRTWNSYNGECDLSQTIQGATLARNGEIYEGYILLQIHQGCDVRGGYTDAVLVRAYDLDYVTWTGNVMGQITKANGEKVFVDDMYNGYSLTDEDGREVTLEDGDKIDLWILEV